MTLNLGRKVKVQKEVGSLGEMKETTTPSWPPQQNRKSWIVYPNVGPVELDSSTKAGSCEVFIAK